MFFTRLIYHSNCCYFLDKDQTSYPSGYLSEQHMIPFLNLNPIGAC